MDVVIYKDIDSLEKIMPKWEALKKEFHDVTVFQELGWFNSWWTYESKQKEITPYIIEIKDRNTTIGIIPLYCSRVTFARIPFRMLKPIGSKFSDYLIPILSKNYCPEKIIKKALKKIYEDKGSWDSIDWGSVPENSVFDSVLNNNIIKEYSLIEREKTTVCPYLVLDDDPEEVKLKLSKNLLKEIQKKERRIRKEGDLQYTIVQSEDEIAPIMNKFFELHCERWENTNTPSRFRYKDDRDYTLMAAKSLFKGNLLHLSYLTHNDEIVAVEFAMSDGNRIYLYLTSFSIHYRKYSVGNILLYHLILESCKGGYKIVDFARGNEGYKQQWGVVNDYNVRYAFYNRSIRSLLYRGINQANKYKHFQSFMEKLCNLVNSYRGFYRRGLR